MHGLRDLRVVDLSTEIAGPYCTRLLADAGAEIVKVEPHGGDPLRRWSATGANLGGRDGALFRFLAAGKRSLVGHLGDAEVDALVADADLVVEDLPAAALDRAAICALQPGLVWLSITPFGLTGPYASRPATDFTVQAESGSIAGRGRPGHEPYQAGGRISEWLGGTFAAAAALCAVRYARESGYGEHIDFSLQEVTAVATNTYVDLMWGILGRPPVTGSAQNVETPSIEPTADGLVGFNTNTAQQISDFLLMIGRPDLRETGEFNLAGQRMARLSEWEAIVHAWTRTRKTEEILEEAGLLRIPVSPVRNGRTVLEHEHLVARRIFGEDPSGGLLRPCPPYRIDGVRPPAATPAPALGAHQHRVAPRGRARRRPHSPRQLPLAGLKIVDATTWWAGPSATHLLASLGADVVHVESIQRPDGARAVGGMFAANRPQWWECSTFFLASNSNKRGVTLNLADARGRDLLLRMVAGADALVENFSPRVMDDFGITWEVVQRTNPRCCYVRMPAFGLDGPWRDRVGFAQTMEQLSGLAWLTGHVKDQPRIQRGPCDPLAGMHAGFALLVALEERDRTGRGHFVECAMVEAALNVAAEQVTEYTAYGGLMERRGNRAFEAAPQGLYACAGHDAQANPRWVALSVRSSAQWDALLDWLGAPAWGARLRGAGLATRHAAHDAIDTELRAVFAARERDECAASLVAVGVPAAALTDGRAVSSNPQLVHRRFFEEICHPGVGAQRVPGMPFRLASVERWLRFPAPTLGQHNGEVLSALGVSGPELAALEAAGVIGERPAGTGA
jgi:crotonobetainyl-CoA:carnitine CoA-transferase CaiB-like acyl-CoA transferase